MVSFFLCSKILNINYFCCFFCFKFRVLFHFCDGLKEFIGVLKFVIIYKLNLLYIFRNNFCIKLLDFREQEIKMEYCIN